MWHHSCIISNIYNQRWKLSTAYDKILKFKECHGYVHLEWGFSQISFNSLHVRAHTCTHACARQHVFVYCANKLALYTLHLSQSLIQKVKTWYWNFYFNSYVLSSILLRYFKNFNLFLKPSGKDKKSSFFLKFLVHLFLYFNQIYLFSDRLYWIYQTLVNFKRGLNGRKNAWEKNS